jgi:prolipoprotein diacylglyceryltransferase
MFTVRFLVEFVKEDQSAFEANMTLNMGQWLSLPLIIAGFIVMGWSLKQKLEPERKNS